MKPLLIISCLLFIFSVANAQVTDSTITVLNIHSNKPVTISTKQEGLRIISSSRDYVTVKCVKEWGKDSIVISYSKFYSYKTGAKPDRRKVEYYKDTTYALAYTDIFAIEQPKRDGSILDPIIRFTFYTMVIASIVSGNVPLLAGAGVVGGLYAAQVILFPYEKKYRIQKNWVLVTVPGRTMNIK